MMSAKVCDGSLEGGVGVGMVVVECDNDGG